MTSRALLCDLGGTRIRFCLEGSTPLDLQELDWQHVRNFSKNPKAFVNAIAWYVDAKKIETKGRQLRLSLPCDVVNDHYSFDNLNSNWAFIGKSIKNEFGFSEIYAMNDAVAAFFGMFELMGDYAQNKTQHFQLLQTGEPHPNGRVVLLCPGTGLGAVGAHRNFNESQTQSINCGSFVPIPSEFGSTRGDWGNAVIDKVVLEYRNNNDAHGEIMKLMTVNYDHPDDDQFDRREFIVSGPGILRLYRYLRTQHNDPPLPLESEKNDWSTPEGIVRMALGLPVLDLALDAKCCREAMALFCHGLARAVADFGKTFTACGGIFLAGSILSAIGAEGLVQFGFLDALHKKVNDSDYSKNVPIYLLHHKNPELVGLSRFA